ncbi:hypothetical protein [uncultured Hoeflea sp.]|uniref:hypothetical protein n=1 Tax=uncultured Hoeflea sp. TaxID=538666 RepID=UPI00263340B8|nr:hypothetical protein [uncultured Hoeflea sp.]
MEIKHDIVICNPLDVAGRLQSRPEITVFKRMVIPTKKRADRRHHRSELDFFARSLLSRPASAEAGRRQCGGTMAANITKV